MKARESHARKEERYIRLTPEQADRYKRSFQARYRGINIVQMPYHNGRAMESCHCCRIMAWVQAVPETIVRILHEEDKLHSSTKVITKEEFKRELSE